MRVAQHGTETVTSVGARDVFVTSRRDRWDALHGLIEASKGQAENLRSSDLLTLASGYRAVSADLAIARRRFPNDPMLRELEVLVQRGRSVVYNRPPARGGIRSFYSTRYWQLVRERLGLLAWCSLWMIIPGIVAYVWTARDPGSAGSMLGSRFAGMRTSWEDLGFSVDEQTRFATEIFVNNIRVSFLAFASGITFGIMTTALLAFNGAILGFVVGLAVAAGNGDVVFALIAGHGVLELTVIVIAAVAGMRMGLALARPGKESRMRALRREAAVAVEIVVGTVPFFVLAGLIEGFFTPAGFGPIWAGIVGVAFGATYWMLVAWRGRLPTDSPPLTNAFALASR